MKVFTKKNFMAWIHPRFFMFKHPLVHVGLVRKNELKWAKISSNKFLTFVRVLFDVIQFRNNSLKVRSIVSLFFSPLWGFSFAINREQRKSHWDQRNCEEGIEQKKLCFYVPVSSKAITSGFKGRARHDQGSWQEHILWKITQGFCRLQQMTTSMEEHRALCLLEQIKLRGKKILSCQCCHEPRMKFACNKEIWPWQIWVQKRVKSIVLMVELGSV